MLTRLAEFVHRVYARHLLARAAAASTVRPPFVFGWRRRPDEHDPAGHARPLDDYERHTLDGLEARFADAPYRQR